MHDDLPNSKLGLFSYTKSSPAKLQLRYKGVNFSLNHRYYSVPAHQSRVTQLAQKNLFLSPSIQLHR